MRGIHFTDTNRRKRTRFIPAHAGNTTEITFTTTKMTVHPRACGEYSSRPSKYANNAGSSPRMRGILSVEREVFDRVRFIPAHAGNTKSTPIHPLAISVHPRACGEYIFICHLCLALLGSSPRMRGIPLHSGCPACGSRFIPAHAGNTSLILFNVVFISVHPRACGEYSIGFLLTTPQSGSSPRMRGIPTHQKTIIPFPRFIPAHAGNTNLLADLPSFDGGSSPRMRGIRCGYHWRVDH